MPDTPRCWLLLVTRNTVHGDKALHAGIRMQYMGIKAWHEPLVGVDIVAAEGQELHASLGKLALQLAHFSCVSRAQVRRYVG